MTALIASMNWWQLIIVIVVLTGSIISIISVLFRAIGFRKIQVSKNNGLVITPEEGPDTKKENEESAHIESLEIKDRYFLIIEKVSYTVSAMENLKYRRRLKEQMNYVEQRTYELKSLTELFYYQFIFKKNPEIVLTKEDEAQKELYFKRYFSLVLSEVNTKIKDFIRGSFIDNHYTEMQEDEFIVYAKKKAISTFAIFKENFKLYYLPDIFITSKIDDITKYEKFEEDFTKIIYDLFIIARKVSLGIEEQVRELEQEMNIYIKKLIEQKVC